MSNEATRKVEEKNGKGDVPTCLFLQKVGSWPKQLFFFHVFFRILKVSFFTISTNHFHPVLWPSKIQCFRFENPVTEVQSLRWEPGKKTNSGFFLCKSSRIHGFFVGGFFFKQNVDGRLKKENWNNQPMRCHFLMPIMRHQVHQYMSPLFHGEEKPDLWCKGAWNIYSLIGAKASSMQVVSSGSIWI